MGLDPKIQQKLLNVNYLLRLHNFSHVNNITDVTPVIVNLISIKTDFLSITIPFRVYITDKEKIIDLHHLILESERPGILNWILEGIERLLINERFSGSQEAEKALKEYTNESNSVISFILEEWNKQSKAPEGKGQLKGMYLDYQIWCSETGRKPVGKITFSERLQLAACFFRLYRKASSLEKAFKLYPFSNGFSNKGLFSFVIS